MSSGPETPLPRLIQNADHLSILRHIRAHKLPNSSHLVVRHGQQLLNNSKAWRSSLMEIERLACLEQICIAALEEADDDLATDALQKIAAATAAASPSTSTSSTPSTEASTSSTGPSTPSSGRYHKLLALTLENEQKYDQAMQVYNQMIQNNPSNSHAQKRIYCILKATGNHQEAKTYLNSYLENNGTDVAAWVEMADSCSSIGDYAGAAYCYEEVVLSSPLDSNVHCYLGELYVSVGGRDSLKLARKHLALALELDPTNLRALFGIVSAAETYLTLADRHGVSSTTGGNVSKKKKSDKANYFDEDDVQMAKDLYQYGVGKLSNTYKGTFMSSLLEMILEKEE